MVKREGSIIRARDVIMIKREPLQPNEKERSEYIDIVIKIRLWYRTILAGLPENESGLGLIVGFVRTDVAAWTPELINRPQSEKQLHLPPNLLFVLLSTHSFTLCPRLSQSLDWQ